MAKSRKVKEEDGEAKKTVTSHRRGVLFFTAGSALLTWHNHVCPMGMSIRMPFTNTSDHRRATRRSRRNGLPFPRRWRCSHLRLLSLRMCSV